MTSINELQKEMYAKGLKVEKYFKQLAENEGYYCTTATSYQDRWEHWDVKLTKDGKSALVDVKGFKKSHETCFT